MSLLQHAPALSPERLLDAPLSELLAETGALLGEALGVGAAPVPEPLRMKVLA